MNDSQVRQQDAPLLELRDVRRRYSQGTINLDVLIGASLPTQISQCLIHAKGQRIARLWPVQRYPGNLRIDRDDDVIRH